jgi:MFS family permease
MGASFWPIAVTMIGFSLLVDRTGYKKPMYLAFMLQAASGVLYFVADGYSGLYYASVCAGLGHGIVEAVINPVCAAVYPKEKTTRLTILHAAWPAGLAGGTLLFMLADTVGLTSWRIQGLFILVPAIAYALMYRPCRLPVDERVQAGVSFKAMLQQVGFLSATLASTLLVFELGKTLGFATEANWLQNSVYAGVAIGVAFGLYVRSLGRPLFFLMCLLMVPVATAELATDSGIMKLVGPSVESLGISAGFAIVFSAGVMLVLRVFAGGIMKHISPPALLSISGLLSAIGLWWLSGAEVGAAVFVAFLIYAIGQTYYWPCILGFTAERYPQGGALTLNTVSAMGLLSLGVIGTPILGVQFDKQIHAALTEKAPAFAEVATAPGSFLGGGHNMIAPGIKVTADEDANKNGILDREELIGPEGNPILTATWGYMDGLSAEDNAALRATYDEEEELAGRSVLVYATRFPLMLVLVFGVIFLYFRSKGGYKPIELTEEDPT